MAGGKEKRLRHIGFIMDGNGRWAKQHGKARSFGHRKGANTIEHVLDACYAKGVEAVSLYAFSTENWARPKEEVDTIFSLLRSFLKKYSKRLMDKKIRFIISGDLAMVEDSLREECLKLIEKTKNNKE